jgi:hypothetical protein
VEWIVINRSEDLADSLRDTWFRTALQYQVDFEARWTRQDDPRHLVFLDDHDIDEIRADKENIKTWIVDARKDYVDRTRRF